MTATASTRAEDHSYCQRLAGRDRARRIGRRKVSEAEGNVARSTEEDGGSPGDPPPVRVLSDFLI